MPRQRPGGREAEWSRGGMLPRIDVGLELRVNSQLPSPNSQRVRAWELGVGGWELTGREPSGERLLGSRAVALQRGHAREAGAEQDHGRGLRRVRRVSAAVDRREEELLASGRGAAERRGEDELLGARETRQIEVADARIRKAVAGIGR